MSETQHNRRHDDNGFELKLPFGSLSGRGWISIVGLVIIGVFGSATGLIYINYKGFEDVKTILKTTTIEHNEVFKAQERLGCIVSLTVEERTKLRLGGPTQWQNLCPWLR